MAQLFSFIKLVLREGSLRESPLDFNDYKKQVLLGLGYDGKGNNSGLYKIKAQFLGLLLKFPVLWNLLQNIVYIKNSIKKVDYNLLIIDDLQLIYFRIPKAASTAQLAALMKKLNTGLDIDNLNADQIDVLADTYLEKSLPQSAKNYYKYSIIRNPFARLASVYIAYFQGLNGNKYKKKRDDPFNYKNFLFSILKYDDTFPTFVEKIACIPEWLRDHHLKSQYRLLGLNKFKDVKWFKLEKLEQEFSEIKEWYHLEIPIINQNPKYDYKSFYDKDLARMVYNIYKKDVEYFGYQKEYEELLYQDNE